ncbi:MAG: rhodanese-like domain-containing protein [Spirochaetes bacterium]|nr:rhodanese-like domain-containing protein [Spirochaetota bacterium]
MGIYIKIKHVTNFCHYWPRSYQLACETGTHSYQASLILKANGIKNVKILEGGLRMWPCRVSRE